MGLGQLERQNGAQPGGHDRIQPVPHAPALPRQYYNLLRDVTILCCSCWAHQGQKEGEKHTGSAAVGLRQADGQAAWLSPYRLSLYRGLVAPLIGHCPRPREESKSALMGCSVRMH